MFAGFFTPYSIDHTGSRGPAMPSSHYIDLKVVNEGGDLERAFPAEAAQCERAVFFLLATDSSPRFRPAIRMSVRAMATSP
jgi:hypothetical protein